MSGAPFSFGEYRSTHAFRVGDWYACEWPERMPVLDVTWFHHNCYPCSLAAKAMDSRWSRAPWPNLSDCLDQTLAGRTKLDTEGHTISRYTTRLVAIDVVGNQFADRARSGGSR